MVRRSRTEVFADKRLRKVWIDLPPSGSSARSPFFRGSSLVPPLSVPPALTSRADVHAHRHYQPSLQHWKGKKKVELRKHQERKHHEVCRGLIGNLKQLMGYSVGHCDPLAQEAVYTLFPRNPRGRHCTPAKRFTPSRSSGQRWLCGTAPVWPL